MQLSDLKPARGSKIRRTRLGRGRSSGLGKTSGRGQKGQGAHNKHKKAGFEGGQTPLAIRLPKRGFRNFHRRRFAIVNVVDLERAAARAPVGTLLDADRLCELGILADSLDGLRVLGEGELSKALTVRALHFSKSARQKIEKAGGQALEVVQV